MTYEIGFFQCFALKAQTFGRRATACRFGGTYQSRNDDFAHFGDLEKQETNRFIYGQRQTESRRRPAIPI